MPLDSNDPEIISAHRRIVDGESLNWLLLNYDTSDRLSLTASGTGGLLELKNKIAGSACFGFCRVDVNGRHRFVLINYIPETSIGISRARALVHSRQVALLFMSRDTTITVDNVEDLTIDFVRCTIAESDWSEAIDPPHPPEKDIVDKSLPVIPTPEQVKRPMSEQSASHPLARTGIFTFFPRRKREKQHVYDHPDHPSLAPLKDKGRSSIEHPHIHPMAASDKVSEQPVNLPATAEQQSIYLSEVAIQPSLDELGTIVFDPKPQLRPNILALRPNQAPRTHNLSLTLDPVERARRRTEKQRQAEADEKQAVREEADRRIRLMKQKEEDIKREEEAAELRKIELQEMVRQVMVERKRKAKEEMETELRKSLELEERKKAEKEKRIEQSRLSEQRRKEKSRLTEELLNKEQQVLQQADEERKMQIKLAKASVTGKLKMGATVTGWVTIQTNETLFWKRRFYQFIGSTWIFYRSVQDSHTILDEVELRGRIDSLKEWYEGHEELKAIPHSFAIQFRDGQGVWSVFTDSEEDK